MVIAAITQGVRKNFTALSIYLENAANSIWGHTMRATQEIAGNTLTLSLCLESKLRDKPLNGVDVNDREWSLMLLQVEDPLLLNITARAIRISPLACRVLIQVDRPGSEVLAGRKMELTYPGQTLTSKTDDSGTAHFEPVPIAAVPNAVIRFAA